MTAERGMQERERTIAVQIADRHGAPIDLIDELLRIERSPVGRRGPHGINMQVDALIQRVASGKPAALDEEAQGSAELRFDNGYSARPAVGDPVRIVSLRLENFAMFRDARLEVAPDVRKPVHLIEGANGFGKSTLVQALRFVLGGHRPTPRWLHFDAPRPAADIRVSLVLQSRVEGRVTIKWLHQFEHGGTGWRRKGNGDLIVRMGDPPRDLRDEEAREWLHGRFPPAVLDYFIFDAESSPVAALAESVGKPGYEVRAQVERALGLGPIRQLADRCGKRAKAYREQSEPREDIPGPGQIRADIQKHTAEAQEFVELIAEIETDLEQCDDDLRDAQRRYETLTEQGDPRRFDERTALANRHAELRREIDERRGALARLVRHDLPLRLLAPVLERLGADDDSAAPATRRAWRSGAHHVVDRVAAWAASGELPGLPAASISASILAEGLRKRLEIGTGPEDSDDDATLDRVAFERIRGAIQRASRSTIGGDMPAALAELETRAAETEAALERPGRAEVGPDWRRQLEQVVDQRVDLRERRSKLGERLDAHRNHLETLESDRETLERTLPRIEAEHARHRQIQEEINLARAASRVFETLADELRDARIDELEKAATVIFRRLTNKPDYYDRIVFNRDTLMYHLLDYQGSPVPPERSTGERAVLALSLVHGLQKAADQSFPLVIEAPLKPLDAAHSGNVLQYFFKPTTHQTFLLVKPGELSRDLEPWIREQIGHRFVLQRPQPDVERTEIVAEPRDPAPDPLAEADP